MTETIKPTRSELFRVRKRAKLARKGHDLLKKKQDALLLEFFRLLKESRERHDALQSAYLDADRRMREARALESDLRIRAAALAVAEGAPARNAVRNVAGVRVPEIRREPGVRAGPVADTLLIQDLGLRYGVVVDRVLEAAARETALRRVLAEIKRVKRRSLALEKILIPRLQSQESRIRLELEERGREEFVRLKKRKRTA